MPVERVVLAGFSQGACLVAEMLEREPRPYAGAAILTGGLFGTEEELHAPPALDDMPVLITGHVDDSWVPVPRVAADGGAAAGGGRARRARDP